MNDIYVKELREAIVAVDVVLSRLDRAKKSINSAQGLGVLDLLGGKKFMTFLKRRQISKAENEIAKAKKEIKNLNKELADLNEYVDIDFNIGALLGFFDYFFGGAFADWIVLGKLGKAKKNIDDARRQLFDIKVKLEDLLAREYSR
ncbi:hypothetical protein [Neofamilia massiliensis]|uniref:hypothetical protein n=1 Tax=Neofamilia massiliensis TaxID=1673724 RepID=UPI0006BB8557|nr:hypothetical protein [Neofamilia massiliensis]